MVALSSQPGGSSSSESDSGRKAGKEKQTLKGFSQEKNLEKKSLIAGPYHDGTVKVSFYFKEYR
jgi:hypothetical protein